MWYICGLYWDERGEKSNRKAAVTPLADPSSLLHGCSSSSGATRPRRVQSSSPAFITQTWTMRHFYTLKARLKPLFLTLLGKLRKHPVIRLNTSKISILLFQALAFWASTRGITKQSVGALKEESCSIPENSLLHPLVLNSPPAHRLWGFYPY